MTLSADGWFTRPDGVRLDDDDPDEDEDDEDEFGNDDDEEDDEDDDEEVPETWQVRAHE